MQLPAGVDEARRVRSFYKRNLFLDLYPSRGQTERAAGDYFHQRLLLVAPGNIPKFHALF